MGGAQGIGHANLLHHANGRDIVGTGQGIAQRDWAMILAIIVFGAVIGAVGLGKSGRHIQNHAGRRHTFFDGG